MHSDKDFLTVMTATDGTLMVSGEIDMAGGPILEQAMLERETQLSAGSRGDLVVDLAEVHFIDSSGLRCLLASARRAAGRRSQLELRSVGPEVVRLFEITGTLDQFRFGARRG